MLIGDLQRLTRHYYEFLDVIISDEELYSNYYDQIEESQRKTLFENDKLDDYVYEMIIKDILYDFVFNLDKVELDMITASNYFNEEYSKKKTINMYKEIQEVFKDFYVRAIEREIKGE